MNENRSFLKKYAATLVLTVSVVLFLPKVLFAQVAVIGYAAADGDAPPNYNSFPSNDQLDRLTHVIAMDVYPDADGYLKSNQLPSLKSNIIWTNQTDVWLANLVNRAHAKSKKVSIGVSGVGSASSSGH